MAKKALKDIKRPTKRHLIEALEGAHYEIRKRGWGRGWIGPDLEATVCILGGVGAACSASAVLDDPDVSLADKENLLDQIAYSPVAQEVARELAVTLNFTLEDEYEQYDPVELVISWNDDPLGGAKDRAEVLRTITRTIKRLRGA